MTHRTTTWNAPYTFSGKEKDVETGYGYFGARYYDRGLSIWLSVDPMSDKYPSMSPYNYCANNPVILVDPDGREVEGLEWKKNKDGVWVAGPGDSAGSLAKDANVSQATAEAAVRGANEKRGQPRTSDLMVYEGDKVTLPSQQTTTSNSASNGNSQTKKTESNSSPARALTISGAFVLGLGVCFDIGLIGDGKDGGLYLSFGFCDGVDVSLGINGAKYKNLDKAKGIADVIAGSILFADLFKNCPNGGGGFGVSLSPFLFGATGRRTFSTVIEFDTKSYGETISKFGHQKR